MDKKRGRRSRRGVGRNAGFVALAAVLIMMIWDGVQNAEPDLFMDTTDLIRRYKYPVETHTVTTADGYILTIHRMPGNIVNSTGLKSGKRPPVLLQHGIMCGSDSWVLLGPDKDLAFMLVEAGFDVWLGNSRGNDYSHGHSRLQINSPEFWSFSWHEMGYYDLPAVIDYILTTTGESKLNYVGYSMGTTMFFVMTSTRPEYNDKIIQMVGLAPAATLHYLSHFQMFGINFLYTVYSLSTLFGRFQVFPRTDFRSYASYAVCRDGMVITHIICKEIGFAIAGRSDAQNMTLIPSIYSHVPASISVHTISHFIQNLESGKFRQYDYGRSGNFRKYNQSEPPEYDLNKVTVPVTLHYSDNDILTHSAAVLELSKQLPNVTNIRRVPLKDFNHFDFMWGNGANRLLYDNVVETLLQLR